MNSKPLWTLLLTLNLSLSGLSAKPTQIMVIKRVGEGPYRLGEVVSGSLEVPGKVSLTVLLLGKGRRWEIVGPAKLKIAEDGLMVETGTIKELPRAGTLALPSDDNDRQVGGIVVRNAGSAAHVESAQLEWVGQPKLVWSIPAQSSPPKALQYEFYEHFIPPTIDASQTKVCRAALGSPFKSGPVLIEKGEYQVPWPDSLAPGESAAVRLVDNEGQEYFYSRVLRPARGHYKQQAEASGELAGWLASEPKSGQVWLVYARFLENQGHFLESLAALGKAIQLEGPQPDLLQLKTRILLDCGRYAEALETYRQMNQTPSQP